MNKKHNSDTEKITNRINFQERPKICLIDIDHNTAEILTEHGFNCTIASFGSQIRVPNTQQGQHQLCRINANLPPNLHEYEIVIIDLKEKESLAYNSSEHRQNITKDSSQHFFICQYPQTIFDPIPLGGYIAENDIKENRRKESIIVVFADQKYSCAYLPGELTPYGLKYHDQFEENNYSFLPSVPIKDNKSGFETNIVPGSDTEFRDFLRKYNKRFIYEITFFHPTRWDKQQKVSVRDEKLIPLATNSSDELISYAYIDNESILFVFPQLEEKQIFS